MTSTAGQSEIYHARMVQVISVTPGQNSTQVQGHTRTVYSQPQEGRLDLFSKDIHHRHQLDTSSQQGKMGSDGDKTPPLPPRSTKCGGRSTSAQERLNLRTGNRNFLSKYFEQNSYAHGNKTVNGEVKQPKGILKKPETSLFQETEKGRDSPPPKLPPRIRKRPVSYPTKEDAVSPPNGIIVGMPNGNRAYPQPLTKTNVTKHDQIWTKEENEKTVNGVLSPPLNHITPESTEKMWEKFSMLDVLDSASDHSDSSADTMIMMTTEEEEKNQSRITQSMQKYKTQKDHHDVFNKNIQIQFESAGNIESQVADKKSTKSISQLSPKSEDTDDGYGTNSSQGTTVSSPLSSSLTSLNVISDTDISIVHGAPKLATATSTTQQNNSAIQNSSKTTWAVRRRTKMAEAKENASSLQEQLRELAIIEEEDACNTQTIDVSENSDRVTSSRSSCVKMRRSPQNVIPHADDTSDSVTSDLEKFEGDLYDKMIDMDRNYRNYYGFDKDFDIKAEDSKVLYFQDKVLKQSYGSDNYYNPRGYYAKDYGDQSSERLGPPPMSSVGSLPRNASLSRDYSSQERSSYRSTTSSGVDSVDGRIHQLTNMSMDNIRVPKNLTLPGMPSKGHFSSSDNLTQNGRRPLFASSADIQKLFQTRDNISDQLQRPPSCRHSFHAMPCTQQWIVDAQNEAHKNTPRPRASSASVSSKSKPSWNFFGGMFGKKKNKSNESNQDVVAKNKASKETNPPQKPIIKSGANISTMPNGPLRRYAEKRGMDALPNGNVRDTPLRSVKHVAPSGTKLSTLV